MTSTLLFGFLAMFLMVGFFIWIKKSIDASIEKRFQEASTKAIHDNLESILTLAGKTLEEKASTIRESLNSNEKSIKTLVQEIQSQVKTYQQEIKLTEHDRILKFSEISAVTARLSLSTEKLNKILQTNSLRGQWGEKIAEDILKTAGLIENIHYLKNKQQETIATRPDYTFLLPEEYKINMDVKFPISNLLKAQETENQDEQKRLLKEFESDVKNRIQEISKRNYINPEENTVDFAILFVPSESVYQAIHANCAGVFEYAEERKIVLAAPFTLMSILKVIVQSFRYFHYEKKIQEMVILIEKLGEDLIRFQDRFGNFEGQIQKMNIAYQEIAKTSFQKIESKIAQIKALKLGQASEESEQISLSQKSDLP